MKQFLRLIPICFIPLILICVFGIYWELKKLNNHLNSENSISQPIHQHQANGMLTGMDNSAYPEKIAIESPLVYYMRTMNYRETNYPAIPVVIMEDRSTKN